MGRFIENYIKNVDGKTELIVEMDMPQSTWHIFRKWPQALESEGIGRG
jgi:hypothetical protein